MNYPLLFFTLYLLLVNEAVVSFVIPSITNRYVVERTNHVNFSSFNKATFSKQEKIPFPTRTLYSSTNGSNNDNAENELSSLSTTTSTTTTTPSSSPSPSPSPTFRNTPNTGLVSMMLLDTRDVLLPYANKLDDASGGWALYYANLAPESETTPIGQAFLATNLGYAIAGLYLTANGDPLLGLLTDCASVASFLYHYSQLQVSANRGQDATVRVALLIDYICAFTAIFVGISYVYADHQLPPTDALLSVTIGLACFFAGWKWDKGVQYLVLHSLWHLFSAYTAYSIGNAHLSLTA